MLQEAKNRSVVNLQALQETSKIKVQQCEKQVNKQYKAMEDLQKNYFGLEKQNLGLKEEIDRLNLTIKKLKLRKGNLGQLQKMCYNCKKDFSEQDNFNWSCRVHQSQWSGEMWWCCGKSQLSALGCKFGKHMTKDDEEEVENSKVKLRVTRCLCCKDYGHVIENCPVDPNFKTNAANQDTELSRI